MKATKLLLMLFVGVLIGIVAYWFVNQPKSEDLIANARADVRESASRVRDSLKQTFDAETIKEELARTGRVVREKTSRAGEAVTDAAANLRIATAIKAKLVGQAGFSAFKIDVDATDGVVTLSGTVGSPEDIAQAIRLALEVEGVRQVISTLLVKAD